MNLTTITTPCTQAYFEMMKGRRGNCRYCKCGWFGHLARHCRQKEILEKRRRKSVDGGNKFTPLLSKVYRRMEGGNAARPYKGETQPTRCWECGEAEHVLWGCPNRVAWPRKAEAQQVRRTEKRKCGACGGDNHRDKKCPSVRL